MLFLQIKQRNEIMRIKDAIVYGYRCAIRSFRSTEKKLTDSIALRSLSLCVYFFGSEKNHKKNKTLQIGTKNSTDSLIPDSSACPNSESRSSVLRSRSCVDESRDDRL